MKRSCSGKQCGLAQHIVAQAAPWETSLPNGACSWLGLLSWVRCYGLVTCGILYSLICSESFFNSMAVNFTGRRSVTTAVNGSVPGPILRWREGDTVTLAVTNRLPELRRSTGMLSTFPSGMDGVPGLSYPGIAPNETFVYRIPVVQHGTYWYHSHSRFREQTGLIGPLTIDRQNKDPIEVFVISSLSQIAKLINV
jgi:hypothetical protein